MSQVNHIIVNIGEQRLYCIDRHEKIVCEYPVSTSGYGTGNQDGSFKTPLGKHSIAQKIGEGCAVNEIFIARKAQGVQDDLLKAKKKLPQDIISSRILWLQGLEPGLNQGRNNQGDSIDSYLRYIYIHGTAEEDKIGQPVSHGCVRMRNKDVIELFDLVEEGCQVIIEEKFDE